MFRKNKDVDKHFERKHKFFPFGSAANSNYCPWVNMSRNIKLKLSLFFPQVFYPIRVAARILRDIYY